MEENKEIEQTMEITRQPEINGIAKFHQKLSDDISKCGPFEWECDAYKQANMLKLYRTDVNYKKTEDIDVTSEVLGFFQKRILEGKPIITSTYGKPRNGKSYFTLCLAELARRNGTISVQFNIGEGNLIKDSISGYVIDQISTPWKLKDTGEHLTKEDIINNIISSVENKPINIHFVFSTRCGNGYDYEFMPIEFSSKPEGWAKAIVFKNGIPIGRICLPHPKFMVSEQELERYEKARDSYLTTLIGSSPEKIGTFKAKIFKVDKLSKVRKDGTQNSYSYGAMTMQSPKLMKYVGKHVIIEMSVAPDEPVTPQESEQAKEETAPVQIPRPEEVAVASGDDKSPSSETPTGGQLKVGPKDDVGGTSPPGAANLIEMPKELDEVLTGKKSEAPMCKCGVRMIQGDNGWTCLLENAENKSEHGVAEVMPTPVPRDPGRHRY